MPQLRARVLLLLCAFVGLTVSVPATGPTFWTVATAAEFLRGTSDGVFVSLQGVLTPGPTTSSRLASAPPQVWSIAEAPDGTIWAGTGGDGRLIRLRPGQTEETVYDADESHIFAVALSGSRAYAATSPDGRVYVVDGTAPARPFFDPQEKYIWALAVDASGRLWIGAGNPAVIYRVDPNGAGTAVYRPPASHAVSLALDAEGRLLVGTESPGRLYRLGANDRPFVLLDSGLSELRAAVVQPDGTIYTAAVSRGDESPAGGETTSVAVTMAAPPAPGATAAPPARRSVLYRIETSGAWEPVWETSDVIYDLAQARDGAVLAASGPEGRLYRIEPSRNVQLLTGVDARQITRFAGPARGTAELPAFATATPGRVMSPGGAPGASAAYVSPVRDTKSVATWGLIKWEGAGAVTLFTRSGNTEKPDDSWSDWAGPYSRPEGETIQSPPARFLQWRAVFGRAAAAPSRLTSVTVAYLPRNSRPIISALTAHPPGVVFARPFASEDGAIFGLDDATANARRPPGDAGQPSPSPGRRMFQKGLQTIVWKAEDPDGDRLSYRLQYRREGETTWRDLRSDLIDTVWVWDTTSVADGRYVVRVLASDEAANPSDRVLAGERESDPIDIDNTPPVVTPEIARQPSGVRLVVLVRDAYSPIQKLEYSVAGGAWQLVYPTDGLADAREERFEIALASEAEAARIVLRATDLLQNVSSVPGGR